MEIITNIELMGMQLTNVKVKIYKYEVVVNDRLIIDFYYESSDGKKVGNYERIEIPAYTVSTDEEGKEVKTLNEDYASVANAEATVESILKKHKFSEEK